MKKFTLITSVTLATMYFTQNLSAQGTLTIDRTPPGSGGPWPSPPSLGLGQYPPRQPGGFVFAPPSLPPDVVAPTIVFAVPEPSAVGLLAVGGGMVGWLLRRRRV
jgi:hypothetical protein